MRQTLHDIEIFFTEQIIVRKAKMIENSNERILIGMHMRERIFEGEASHETSKYVYVINQLILKIKKNTT